MKAYSQFQDSPNLNKLIKLFENIDISFDLRNFENLYMNIDTLNSEGLNFLGNKVGFTRNYVSLGTKLTEVLGFKKSNTGNFNYSNFAIPTPNKYLIYDDVTYKKFILYRYFKINVNSSIAGVFYFCNKIFGFDEFKIVENIGSITILIINKTIDNLTLGFLLNSQNFPICAGISYTFIQNVGLLNINFILNTNTLA